MNESCRQVARRVRGSGEFTRKEGLPMNASLPRVRRKDRSSTYVWVLGVVAVAMAVVVGYLLSQEIFSPGQPQSIADRDIALLRAQLASTPADAQVLARLAELEYQKGQTQEALRDGAEAVKAAGQQPVIRLQYAGILMQAGKPGEAKQLALDEIALPSTQTEADGYLILGEAERDLGDSAGALKAMQQSLKLNPVAADIRDMYADMLRQSGNKAEAIAQYQRVLKYLPGDSAALEGLKALGVTPSASTTTSPHGSSSPGGY